MPSLHDIEKTIVTLCLDRDSREWVSSGAKKLPPALACLDKKVIADLDRKGAGVYARSADYEYQDMADCIFPYTAKVLGADWEDLVDSYYKLYPSKHFDFNLVCLHFSQYLRENCAELIEKYPYIAELADYEWLEQEKGADPRRIELAPAVAITGLEQITEYFPVVNQTVTVRHYRYPIVEIARNFEEKKRPAKKFKEKPCIVAIYRDAETDQPRFMQLGEASAAVVETAQKEPALYQDLLRLVLSLTPEINPNQAVIEFLDLIAGLAKDSIFVGSLRKEVKNVI